MSALRRCAMQSCLQERRSCQGYPRHPFRQRGDGTSMGGSLQRRRPAGRRRSLHPLRPSHPYQGDDQGDCRNDAEKPLPSLEIDFCGIRCENPFFLASSAVCTNYEMAARAFEAGWAGVFYKTICLDDIREVSPRFDAVSDGGTADFFGFRNMEQLSENCRRGFRHPAPTEGELPQENCGGQHHGTD